MRTYCVHTTFIAGKDCPLPTTHDILLTSTWRIRTQTDRLTVLLTVQTKEHTGDIPFTVSKQTAGLNTLTAHSRRQYKHTTGKTLRLFN